MTALTLLADASPTFPDWLPSALVAVKIFILINVILGLVSCTVCAERKIRSTILYRLGISLQIDFSKSIDPSTR